jgi:uncharacterized protein (TIGR03118 family)
MALFSFGRIARACGAALVGAALLAACGGGDSSSMGGTGSTGGGTGPGYGGGGGTGGGTGGTGTGTGYAMTALVADGSGAAHTDAHLVNGWGLAFNPAGFAWVANNGTNTSTLYDGAGVPQSLVVTIPDGNAGPAAPTGIVFNASATDFMVTQGSASGASAFLFVGEAGTLSGWSPDAAPTAAITMFDGSASGTVFKGLALATQGTAQFLYAADFHNARVMVFDSHFAPVTPSGGFVDPNLPAGYAPFGIQALGNKLYVAYAEQDADAHDEVAGAGLGVIDVYDTGGTLLQRLTSGGPLNAPWGMAMAPANFGTLSNDLLVGNFGDGKINAFDPTTGAFVGTLSDATGTPIVIDGLWGIAFGNGLNSQPTNTLFFAAGPGSEAHGLYGRIDAM